MHNRRTLLLQGLSGLVVPSIGFAASPREVDPDKNLRMPNFKESVFKTLEKRARGRIGVFAVQGRHSVAYRAEDRFAMCSTFKWILAAAILREVDQGRLSLDQPVKFTQADLLEYAPTTRAHVAEGAMTVEALCAATVSLSDNTAANLLLPLIGGPKGLTAFVRGLGDKMTRLDRNEPDLNTNIKGDPRDTTTPQAMAELLLSVYRRKVLEPDSLARLKAWMVATSTGLDCIRAAAPEDWVVGDKTGSGAYGARNDVAVLWPPSDSPVFMAIYTTGNKLDMAGRNRLIADITRAALDELA